MTPSQAVLPHLRKSKGCIVNVSSLGGIAPSNTMLPYCVAKAGVDMLTKATALEYANEVGATLTLRCWVAVML